MPRPDRAPIQSLGSQKAKEIFRTVIDNRSSILKAKKDAKIMARKQVRPQNRGR